MPEKPMSVIPSGLALEWSPLLNHLLLTWGYKRGYKGERKRPPSELRGQKHVIPLGFEPKTHSLEGCCSIQLSYGTVRII